MALLRRVIRAFEQFAPLSLAESWDNVGVLLEAPFSNADATSVLLTIDLTTPVLEEALAIRPPVGVIVSYHPVLFRAEKRFTMADPKQRIALKCAAAGISIFSPHTALDSTIGGINDHLASIFPNVKVVAPITPSTSPLASSAPFNCRNHYSFDGLPLPSTPGSGRIVTLDQPHGFSDLLARIKATLGLPRIRISRPFNPVEEIRTIAICAGSGSSVLVPLAGKADLLFTGEMSHHDLLACQEKGSIAVMCEHSGSERRYLMCLKDVLGEVLKSDGGDVANVVVSEKDKDPVEIV
ncbi:NGG1p interacting factor 3 [Gonapodya prolifera JEL478]|uniref:NGG1p interacting factor 3 n=1 Tax=Gonapodya prolifera (strain JEL478) TaxID=1344416 RepID=A0A139AHU6_GONPJ|nr:NGG1p interacting factor 3 [Gonapodya prolifera JEL478]|eukprot:KXS15983.1 NGG1p interacting factor 3 [Gonapodya prolifera JEL478]